MDFANLKLERRDGVATLTLDRPVALNALDAATLRALRAAFRELDDDPGLRALVLTGAGERAFSAGADIAAMAAMAPEEGAAFSRLGHEAMAAVEALAVPVIGALNGVALGGGLVFGMRAPCIRMLMVAAVAISLETNVLRVASVGAGIEWFGVASRGAIKNWTGWGALAFGVGQVIGLERLMNRWARTA